ncbi:MAG TPA: hypothetical protein VJ810_12135 [Blastocatellia bacterium]|nr:hypothetical protein [Blastocatellia bacterium]
MIHRERFHFAIHFGRQKGGGEEEYQENGAHNSLLSLLLGILILGPSTGRKMRAEKIVNGGFSYFSAHIFLPVLLTNGRNSSK